MQTVRINKFDNIKGLGIFLIVLGHMCFVDNFDSVYLMRNFIYIFHLPLFFFVAGYFSKIDSEQPLKSFKRLALPYILFNIIHAICGLPFRGIVLTIILIPEYTLWFLSALFFMKITLPIVDKFKYPLLFSIIIALSFGLLNYDVDFLGLPRAFIYFPVFLIGFYFNDYKLKLEKDYKKLNELIQNKYFIILLSIFVLVVAIVIAKLFNHETILMMFPYETNYVFNIFIRMVIIGLGMLGTLLVYNVMTNKNCFLTKWGRNSMAIYLFHIFCIFVIRKFLTSYLNNQSVLFCIAFAIVSSLLVTEVLSSDFITYYYNRTMDYAADLILKSE